MTEQQQIDYLKQKVMKLEARLFNIDIAIQNLSDVGNYYQPSCEVCGQTMYEGFSCNNPAKDCPMGVGVNND